MRRKFHSVILQSNSWPFPICNFDLPLTKQYELNIAIFSTFPKQATITFLSRIFCKSAHALLPHSMYTTDTPNNLQIKKNPKQTHL